MDTPSTIPPIASAPQTPSAPPVPPSNPTNKLAPLFIVLFIVICVGAVGWYEYDRYSASKKQQTVQPTETQIPRSAATTTMTTPTLSPEELQQPTSMTEAAYNQAFATALAPELLAEGFTAADGIFVKYVTNDIQLRIPGTIPNLEFTPNQKAKITLSSITDTAGTNILDSKSSFETDAFFTSVDLTKTIDPVFSYEGSRRIHLIDGASSNDIQRIEGTISIQLPIGLTTTTIANTEQNQPKKGIGTATVTSWETTNTPEGTETKINLKYEGIEGQLLAITATDAAGQHLSNFSSSEQTTSDAKIYELTFEGSPATLTMFETERLFTKQIPFTITVTPQQQTSMQEPTSVILDEATKNALIDAEIQREAIFATNDVKKIRAYIQTTADATEQAEVMADVLRMSDDEILQLAKTVNSMFNLGTPEQVRAALLSDKTTWTQLSPNSIKYTYQVNTNESNGSTLMKGKDGKWY